MRHALVLSCDGFPNMLFPAFLTLRIMILVGGLTPRLLFILCNTKLSGTLPYLAGMTSSARRIFYNARLGGTLPNST